MMGLKFIFGLILLAGVRPDHLYFSTPGDASHSAGFYGGYINSSVNDGNFENLFEDNYNCVHHNDEVKTKLNIQSVSFDPISKQALVSVYENDLLTLVSTKLCNTSCSNSTVHVHFYDADLVFENVGPFALFNSTVYFLLNRVTVLDVIVSQSEVELRRMEGCDDKFPVDSSTAFDIEACSIVVSRLSSEKFEDNQKVSPMDSLLVVRIGKQPTFLTLLRDITFTSSGKYASLMLALVKISPNGEHTTLDTQEVDIVFLTWNLHQLGGISYKDGLLCWSVIDRILCADWEPSSDKINNIKVLLGRGHAKEVCRTAMQGEDLLSEVLSGVAIRDSRGPVVYFGCVTEPQAPVGSLGGAGYIDGSTKQVIALTSNSSFLYAGSMLYSEPCDSVASDVTGGTGNHLPNLLCILIICMALMLHSA